MSQIHVIGAGMAGLAAALSLTAAGRSVTLHEAGPAAGGRCRSYYDKELDLRIDNGNHLLLSGNRAALDYIREIGALDRFHHPAHPVFPFIDLRSGERWRVRPNPGRLPWWILAAGRRVPRTRLTDYLAMARIVRVKDDTVVADAMPRGLLFSRLVEPLAVAALNTRPQEGLARLLAAVMQETLLRGGAACIPWLPRQGLSEGLVDPAVTTLRSRGARICFNSRIAEVTIDAGRVTALRGSAGTLALAPGDSVVLAVPPWVAADLLPGLTTPNVFEAILNIHYRFRADAVADRDVDPSAVLAPAGFIGLIGGSAEWVFLKQDHVSVTISAANSLVNEPAAALAARVWPDVCGALGLAGFDPNGGGDHALPPFRVVKERRATFVATAQQELRRPKAGAAPVANLALAGDWTDTGLPATIEGAIRSGRTAAAMVLSV